MTTDRGSRARESAAIMALLLMLWFAVTAAMTLFPGLTGAATVIFPSRNLMNNLPDNVSVLRWDRATASVASADPEFARRLYAAGAFMVLPARKAGCIDLRTLPFVPRLGRI
jgi:hypothetical protein